MRRAGFNSLSDILEQAVQRLELGPAALEARAVMLWPRVVGPQMARASEARRVQAGVLHVVTASSPWNQEFSFQKAVILRRYRQRLGSDFVRDLRFSVGSVHGRPAAPSLSALCAPPDDEVRRLVLPEAERERIREACASTDLELAQAVERALTREAQLRAWHLQHGARECPRCGAAYRSSRSLCPACRVDAGAGKR